MSSLSILTRFTKLNKSSVVRHFRGAPSSRCRRNTNINDAAIHPKWGYCYYYGEANSARLFRNRNWRELSSNYMDLARSFDYGDNIRSHSSAFDSHVGIRAFSTSSTSKSEQQNSFEGTSPEMATSKVDKKDAPIGALSPATSSSSQAPVEKSYTVRAQELTKAGVKIIIDFILKTPGVLWFFLTHPKELREKLIEFKELVKKEAHHYYMGTKLLIADIKTARSILLRTLNGSHLSRRERKQLVRTVSDVFRLVPMSVFVLIPFMEFLLPFALKIFPNMLPSTFQDSLKAEENMKRELQMRLAMAGFLQETLQSLVKKKKGVDSEEKSDNAADFLQFLESARKGDPIPPEAIIKFSKYFKDEFTLENYPRAQLVNLCRYMNIPPYGNDPLLRFQLRHKIRGLKDDDQRIIFEGLENLTKMELREACQERGMRSTGLSKEGYREQLQQWLDLSVVKDVPIALLVISRTYMLQEDLTASRTKETADKTEKAIAGLADAISGLDKDVLNEVVLEVATDEENRTNPDLMKIKLEVVKQQNELIKEENEAREKARELAEVASEEKKAKAEESSKEEVSTDEKEVLDTSKDSIGKMKETSSENQNLKAIAVDASKPVDDSNSKPDIPKHEVKKESAEDKDEEEDENELSPEELDAIKQLITPDSLTSERAELEKIKEAIKSDEIEDKDEVEDVKDKEMNDFETEVVESPRNETEGGVSPEDLKESINDSEFVDALASKSIRDEVEKVEAEFKESTTFSPEINEKEEKKTEDASTTEPSDAKLDKTVTSLKTKVKSMVDKIEAQLESTSVEIGDRMHLLDLDQDGILSKEEVAVCLQTVLKRNLTTEEALEIASDMDSDEDGFFTVGEFNRWVDDNKLVKLVREGREDEIEKIIAKEKSEPNLKDQNDKP